MQDENYLLACDLPAALIRQARGMLESLLSYDTSILDVKEATDTCTEDVTII